MQSGIIARRASNRVSAVFEASIVSFDLSKAATFGNLVERLWSLRERGDGALIRVDVKVRS